MYIKISNVKAIEELKGSYTLIVENKYSKMGEDLFSINEDAYRILINLDGTKTIDDITDMMAKGDSSLKKEAEVILEKFLHTLKDSYGLNIQTLENPIEAKINILGTGDTFYPVVISMEITHNCNAKCLHCYGSYSPQSTYVDNTESIIKVLRDARRAGTRVIELTGGETTCHPRFKEILKEAHKLNYSLVSILSNGLKWDDELFDIIGANKDNTAVQIDLHGDNDNYVNWFMGNNLPDITKKIKETIMRIHDLGTVVRVVTMVTPQNIDQLENIAEWVHSIGIKSYGLSTIIPIGRAGKEDKNNLLMKTEEDVVRLGKAMERIKKRYGKGFLYEEREKQIKSDNCGALTSNPSITPEGNVKFCAMDDETIFRTIGNAFEADIGEIFAKNGLILNAVQNIKAPMYDQPECAECDKRAFCSYCIIRAFTAAKEVGFENCLWYNNNISDEIRRIMA